jgi:atypical dual specificity phosphatase
MDWLYSRTVFYPTLLWNMLLGRWLKTRNWWDIIDDHVVLGAFPFARDVAKLADLGVKGVVNTCEEYAGPTEEYASHGIEQFRMPTIDFTHPKIDDVIAAVEFIERIAASIEESDAPCRVYVHCKAGRARSATVVICWLMKTRQISKEEAQKVINQHRPHVNQQLGSRPVVIEFEERFVK